MAGAGKKGAGGRGVTATRGLPYPYPPQPVSPVQVDASVAARGEEHVPVLRQVAHQPHRRPMRLQASVKCVGSVWRWVGMT